MRGGERRRSIPDSRTNHAAFASNRDIFRDSIGRDNRDFPPREPSRGPKGGPVEHSSGGRDPPSGPRSSTYGGDYRGNLGFRGDFRGRGRGRARFGWRDDSRDRGREQERDYRGPRDDRGPPQIRDDRNRDRDRWDRNDISRGRRASSPQGRARSPNFPPRDNRDGPPPDFDRTRRDSRDGLLSGGSPASDSLQPPGFGRGYGRGNRGSRIRGGRGGYYDDFHPRNPSPDSNFNRRTQPSATPPPQVPAFGSTSSSTQLPPTVPKGPKAETIGPVPGISVPTAPRARLNGHLGRIHNKPGSMRWVEPEHAAKEREKVSDVPHPRHVNSTGEERAGPLDDHLNKPQAPSASTAGATTESRPEEEEAAQNSIEKLRAPSTLEARSPRRDSERQRRSISGRRPAEPRMQPSLEFTDDGSNSDSGDDLDDDFVEDDIRKAEEQMAEASAGGNIPGHPREEPDADYLKPFIDSTVESKVAASEDASLEACLPIELVKAPASELMSIESEGNISVKPKARGRSRLTTPLVELAPVTVSNVDRKTIVSELELLAAAEESSNDIQPPTTQTLQPAPLPTPAVPTSPAPEIQTKPEAGRAAVNGKTRKPVPVDTFEDSDSEPENLWEPTAEDISQVRKQVKTPDVDSLPHFDCKPWDQDEEFLKTLEPDLIVQDFIINKLSEARIRKKREQNEELHAWGARYHQYRRFTDLSMEPAARRSREAFVKSRERTANEAATKSNHAPPLSSKPEPSRRARYGTEADIARVLRESEQEAKGTKDKEDRDARAKTASAKEAKIPDMYWNEEERLANTFIDKSGLVSFERSFAVLEYGEPVDNFTPEECALFEKAYLQTPKQWGIIAEALPRRDYKACIQHYYLVKRDTQLKEKVKKQPKRRKKNPPKGAKPKSNSLMADIRRDDVEEGAELGDDNGRRRLRRAAAPTFAHEVTPGDNDAPSQVPTPGRKSAAAPKGDTGGEAAAPKKRAKATREKVPKSSKNSQLLAAAPTAASRGAGSPSLQPNTAVGRGQVGATAFSQYEGPNVTSNFMPHFAVPPERLNHPLASNFETMPQPFADQERMGSAPPISFDAQQDRRGNSQLQQQPTSSYWSVPEQNDFPELLRYFGTDWGAIAKHMTSKTHVMVYNTNFRQWLVIPTDSNKSRCVANIEKQVKNYYSRQVESGKMDSWASIAKDADAKRARGESTGALPLPIVIPKRSGPQGSLVRSGSAMDLDETPPNGPGPNPMMQQASPPVSSLGTRFPPLAQAGSVPQSVARSTPPASIIDKHVPQQPVQHMQPQSRRAPPLGYFNNTDPQRSAMQTPNPQQVQPTPAMNEASQRSAMVAQEAQKERQQALRLEREQAHAQAQQQAQSQQAQAQSQQIAHQQAMAMQRNNIDRERQFQMKQEADSPNPHQYEQYPTPSMRLANPAGLPRSEASQSNTSVDVRRTAPPSAPLSQHYQPQSHPAIRSVIGESMNVSRASTQSSPSPALPRPPMSAPPASHEQFVAPPLSRMTPVAAVRQQETTRKTSNIMSLLNNDEPTDPRPQPPKRVSDIASTPLQTTQTPPPSQHSLQSARYSVHPSQATPQAPQQHSQQMAQIPPQSQPPQTQNPYASSSPHPMHHHSSSLGQQPRSYTPNPFDQRGYGQPQPAQPQHQHPQSMYSQPPRQAMNSQPPPIRRESSLGDLHGVARGYGSAMSTASTGMRLKDSPYAAATPPVPTSQAGRHIVSPHEQAKAAERDYYSRQSSYLSQSQTSAAGSPQIAPQYHPQALQQHPSHRQLAFGTGPGHTNSPPTSYTSALHQSRHNSFDGRYPSATTSAPSQQQGYAYAPQHQGTQMQYQQPQQHDHYGESYERRLIEEQNQARLEQQQRVSEQLRVADQQRLEQHRLAEDRDRRNLPF